MILCVLCVECFVVLYSMKIKIRIGDVDVNRTEVHQIKSKAFDFGFRRLLLILKE